MKKLFSLLLLFPLLLHAQTLPNPQYLVIPGEYKCFVKSQLHGNLFEVTSGQNVPGAPMGIIDGSASIHHAAFVGPDGAVYVIGDNPSNMSATGSKLATLPFTKTPVTNAKSVVAYDNNGTVGYGELVVTNDGKVVLMGSSQSGFRGDGTEGNAAEPAPYTVPLPKPIKKVVAGTYAFALSVDSTTVYRWGGTRASGGTYWAQYSSGAGVSNPDLTHIGSMTFGEPIVDIIGGGDWSYAIGKSGMWYGWAYDTHFLGFANTPSQLKPFALTNLKFPAPVSKAAVGPEATYSLLTNGDLYAWGDNMQAAIGNGTEGTFANFVAPWGVQANTPWVLTPYKVNPPGIIFVNVFTSIGDAFYVYAEDSKGNLWVFGRNKGYVLWNGQGGTSQDQSDHPNRWDVLSPTIIPGFGTVVVTPPPPPANVLPTAVVFNIDSTVLSASGPDTVSIDGTHSFDKDGSISSYSWSVITGPPGAAIGGGSTATGIFVAAGTYTVQLIVKDNAGALDTALAYVKVLPRTCPPVVVCSPCPPIPPQRSVLSVIVTVLGQDITVPVALIKLINFNNGTTQ